MSDQKQTMELTTKPEANLKLALEHSRGSIMAVAAQNVKGDFEQWLTRAKMDATAKPDVAALLTTKKGIETMLRAITRAATVGLMFGLAKPQAYFVPTDGGVRLDIDARGYAHASVYG